MCAVASACGGSATRWSWDSSIKVANFNGVGGGTILYAGHFPRMHPSDFRVRTLDGVADDWPIDYRTLEPYYALNERDRGRLSFLAEIVLTEPEAASLPTGMPVETRLTEAQTGS